MTSADPGSRRSPRFAAAWGCGALLAGCLLLVGRVPKQALPVARIWNGTRRPVLRLITCGGSFDRSTGHYRDNVIMYANPARP